MVTTPWSTEPMPFDKAAETGTQKVVTEHSTVAVVVTNDGTITDIPRNNYVAAEERVISELKSLGKPFVVVLNSRAPLSTECVSLASALESRHDVKVLPMDLKNMGEAEASMVLSAITEEFDIKKIIVDIPPWMQTLPIDNNVIDNIIKRVKANMHDVTKMKHYQKISVQRCKKPWQRKQIAMKLM